MSFLPTADGFLLAMNRDELRARPSALPSEFARTGRLRSLYPREPGPSLSLRLPLRSVPLKKAPAGSGAMKP